ncbi:hypothetical protein L1987_71121 [Smallanthus sonchifolius]|uniref:Uncharacterized protein n=1 Tax=Smallanthus sonchifolius TaxID=185202 RepID=A0ACB9AQY5_9ASTR|nr:hypothetical protein L1987_71121 [Smallanthus sonchifolius]
MVDQDTTENPTIKRIKQTISVPFLWEEKPGTPKPNWIRVNPIMQLPVKLIASVPFMWEEKPGTPLPGSFSHMSLEQEPKTIMPSSSPHPQQHKKNNPFCDSDTDTGADIDYLDKKHQASESEVGIVHSSPNHLTYRKNNPFCDSSDDELEIEDSDYLQAPSSPAWETESVASSYATGTTSLAGSSFLECMFPLMTPKASFLETVGCSKIRVPPTNSCTQIISYGAERKPMTLGELIMMSRRRSYLKKAIESQEYKHSTELMVRNGFGCCNIDVGGLKRKLQLTLI